MLCIKQLRAPSFVAHRRICNWAHANAVQSGQGPIFDLAAFKRILLDVMTSSTVGAGEPSRSANASVKAALQNVPWQHGELASIGFMGLVTRK